MSALTYSCINVKVWLRLENLKALRRCNIVIKSNPIMKHIYGKMPVAIAAVLSYNNLYNLLFILVLIGRDNGMQSFTASVKIL